MRSGLFAFPLPRTDIEVREQKQGVGCTVDPCAMSSFFSQLNIFRVCARGLTSVLRMEVSPCGGFPSPNGTQMNALWAHRAFRTVSRPQRPRSHSPESPDFSSFDLLRLLHGLSRAVIRNIGCRPFSLLHTSDVWNRHHVLTHLKAWICKLGTESSSSIPQMATPVVQAERRSLRVSRKDQSRSTGAKRTK